MSYVNSKNFTEYELGKVFEQIYLILLQEEERDLRDEANGKVMDHVLATDNG